MDQAAPKSVSEPQLNRACDACRMHKVRCLPNNSATSKTCQRCARTDRQCIYTALQKRKQRKRTDARVAELEREVQAMRTLFEKKEGNEGEDISRQNTSDSSTPFSEQKAGAVPDSAGQSEPGLQINLDWMGAPDHAPQGNPALYSPDSDVIDRGVISLEEATELFNTYTNHLVNYFPAVWFPPEVTFEELRSTRPTLFLAVLAAASAKEGSQLYSILNTEVISAYAHRTVIQGEKSMELVQALIVTSVWYYPPGKYAKLKFYEYIHMAATMALDIGLGTNPKTFRGRRAVDANGYSPPMGELNDEEIDKRRTFLVCYLITTAVSLSMRRPNMLRFNKWISDCLEVVASNPRASKLDKYLVSWVRLMKITEDLGSSLSFEDPSNMADLAEPSVQLKVTGFEKLLEAWKKTSEPDVNDAIMSQYHYSQLYLHEIALYDDHPPEDFKPPFGLEKILTIQTDPRSSSSYIDSTAASISSAQAFLDILINMDLETLRMIPIFNYVRMAYALIILVKLYISSKTPTSHIGAVLDVKSLKIGYYLNAIIERLIEAIGPNECRAPYTFLGMVLRLQAWYSSQEHTEVFTPPIAIHSEDECWLPAVPAIHWHKGLEKREASLNNPSAQRAPSDVTMQNEPLQHHMETMDLNKTRGVTITAQVPLMQPVDGIQQSGIGDEQGVDDFMLYGMESFDPDFGTWVPDMDMTGVLNSNQTPDAFDWGLQGTDDTLI